MEDAKDGAPGGAPEGAEKRVADPYQSLIERLHSREREACEQFVGAHYRGVHRFFLWLTNEPDRAADLTQEAFAAFWASTGRLDPDRVPDLAGWLYGIARNCWRRRCRERHTRMGWDAPLEEAALQVDPGPSPEEAVLAAVDAERAGKAVSALPADFREALALRVFAEMEYSAIAAALGVSENLARWRVFRARAMLRARLDPSARKEKSGAGCS